MRNCYNTKSKCINSCVNRSCFQSYFSDQYCCSERLKTQIWGIVGIVFAVIVACIILVIIVLKYKQLKESKYEFSKVIKEKSVPVFEVEDYQNDRELLLPNSVYQIALEPLKK
ncbi:Hypothetical_protein [Hexamita inflata]|uniref:Hypothetical_protein n=1 Tax=Hexamita inflata TaxID=28002 RepID=A0AA86PE98_9EUKA|nr:Hypothetical protein HINF_LOCUS25159 [Hexamita inflata]